MGCTGTHGLVPRHTHVHMCTTCVPRVWLCSPVPRPGSVRTSPAGSHWPGPGLSSLPRTEQGQLRGHHGHPPGTEQTLCLLVALRATHGRTGLPQEQWHTRATESWKVRPIAMESGLQAPRHWPLLALGTGCMVAIAVDSQWPWLPGGTSHGCPVVPCPGGPVPAYLQLPQALQQLMAGARLSQHCRAPGSRCLGHTFRHRCCGGHTSRRGPCRPLAGGTWPEAPSGPAQPGSPLPGFGCSQPRPCVVSPVGENRA